MRWFTLLLIGCVSVQAAGAVINVPADQATIQAAIVAAVNGDEIIVAPGTYVETTNFLGKAITVRSTDPNDPAVVISTIIDVAEREVVGTAGVGPSPKRLVVGTVDIEPPHEQGRSEEMLVAVRTDTAPTLDGNVDDPAWKDTPTLRLEATGRGGPAEGRTTAVELKAAYDDTRVYILLRWRDATKDDTHKSYIWNQETSAYESGPDREDNAALAFPIRGDFTADMLSGKDQFWDVWHWKAARTGPAGYAMDRTHRFYRTKPAGKAKSFLSKGGLAIWIARPEDAGESVTQEHSAPSAKQDRPPVHYEAVTPSGSAADIRTGHSYHDGWWTVEFARKLNTGERDDAAFSVPGTYPMGVAVFDKSEHEHHFTAGPITLRLEAVSGR